MTGRTRGDRPHPAQLEGEAQGPARARHPQPTALGFSGEKAESEGRRPPDTRLRRWAEEPIRSKGVQASFVLGQPGAPRAARRGCGCTLMEEGLSLLPGVLASLQDAGAARGPQDCALAVPALPLALGLFCVPAEAQEAFLLWPATLTGPLSWEPRGEGDGGVSAGAGGRGLGSGRSPQLGDPDGPQGD